MSTVRLTKYIRETVLARLLKHAFEAREKALEKDKHTFARQVYDAIYPAAIQKAMKALPKGYLPTASYLMVSFDGKYTHVYFGESRLVAECHQYGQYGAAKVFGPKDPLTVRYHELEKIEDALTAEKSKAKSSAEAALNSCTTVKKLIEVWPEVEPFVKDFATTSQSRALAIPIKELNKSLGLPPEGK